MELRKSRVQLWCVDWKWCVELGCWFCSLSSVNCNFLTVQGCLAAHWSSGGGLWCNILPLLRQAEELNGKTDLHRASRISRFNGKWHTCRIVQTVLLDLYQLWGQSHTSYHVVWPTVPKAGVWEGILSRQLKFWILWATYFCCYPLSKSSTLWNVCAFMWFVKFWKLPEVRSSFMVQLALCDLEYSELCVTLTAWHVNC